MYSFLIKILLKLNLLNYFIISSVYYRSLYNIGVESDLSKLYPEVSYPVSRSTPMIAPLVRWNHDNDWYVTSYQLQNKIGSGERIISVSLTEDESEYISGHVIDGRNLFPATGYLVSVECVSYSMYEI